MASLAFQFLQKIHFSFTLLSITFTLHHIFYSNQMDRQGSQLMYKFQNHKWSNSLVYPVANPVLWNSRRGGGDNVNEHCAGSITFNFFCKCNHICKLVSLSFSFFILFTILSLLISYLNIQIFTPLILT